MKRFPMVLGACALALAACAAEAAPPAPTPSHAQFEDGVKTILAPHAGRSVAALKVLHLAADVGPWQDTGLALRRGDRVTLVLDGRTWISRALALSFEPDLMTWARIGPDGPIFRGIGRAHTFTAARDGTLQLKHYSAPWQDRTGRYAADPAPLNPDAGGGASVAIVRWAAGQDPAATLQPLATGVDAPAWTAAALQDLAGHVPVPEGWHYLWELGPADIFREARDGDAKRIDIRTSNDVGILQRDVEVPLRPGTRLAWRWKFDRLPAAAAENAVPTHDYMSIAVEFDNGQDLTYLWSRALAEGTAFRCPLPGWQHRETHVVARSGTSDLGRWLAEDKDVFADYQRTVGGPMPQRIVRVWLIAVSLFQRGEGAGSVADIRVGPPEHMARVW